MPLFLLALVVSACSGEDGSVTLRDADCLACHSAAALARPGVPGSSRNVVDTLGDGFALASGARLEYPKRGHHDPDDLEACRTCHVGHESAADVDQNRNIYPTPALNLLHEPNADCASGCHSWLRAEIFETGFTNVFGLTPFFEGDLDPFRLLKGSAHAGIAELLTGSRVARHKQILLEGWSRPEDEPTLFPMLADRYAPGCGGCHNLSGEERHGEIPSCNDCHHFERDNPPELRGRFSTHEYLVTTIDAFKLLAAPGQFRATSCDFCHVDDSVPTAEADPLTRRSCYNCHISAHQPASEPLILAFWESLPIGLSDEEVAELEQEFLDRFGPP